MIKVHLVSIHARLATGDSLTLFAIASKRVSIHARLATGDWLEKSTSGPMVFQFTPVLRRATSLFTTLPSPMRFQFTPVLRRATRRVPSTRDFDVSIHARLATGDSCSIRPRARRCFNSRPSCDGRHIVVDPYANDTFQFTPVLRRATLHRGERIHPRRFNSRPSCDGRPP